MNKNLRNPLIIISMILFFSTVETHLMGQNTVKKDSERNDQETKMEWWRNSRFGMFITWGVSSVLGGEYQGHPQAMGGAEWVMNRMKIPVTDYVKFASEFNPVKFDADAVIKMAKDAGMRYVVFVAKHHDGFAMFNSKVSDWNIVQATPYGRDILNDLSKACKRYGIKLGIYYSQAQDWVNSGGSAGRRLMRQGWSNPDSTIIDNYTLNHSGHWDPKQSTRSMQEYIDSVAVPQVRELLTNYGSISIIWWDTPYGMEVGFAKKLHNLLKLQPGIIENDRLMYAPGIDGNDRNENEATFLGDFLTPEQHVPKVRVKGKDFEVCMTMNSSWGFKKNDSQWKSSNDIIKILADIVSKGGNYLLNIGPKPDGTIPEESVLILNDIGNWMRTNGESIYETVVSDLNEPEWGRITEKQKHDKKVYYLFLFDIPENNQIEIEGIKNHVNEVMVLGMQSKVVSMEGSDKLKLILPLDLPRDRVSVVKLETTY